MRPASLLILLALLTACASMTTMLNRDPYLWMEDVEGERALAWVRAENARSLTQLEGDARYPQLLADALAIANSADRLPTGAIRDGFYYNFWQDAQHVRGLWRRTRLADFARNDPHWDVLLDMDALAAAEGKNWVYKGVLCAPGGARCMVSLSDGGRDAATWREFDMASKSFVDGGFVVPEAKSTLVYLNADSLLVGTDWGPGTLSESGYATIIKLWRRGTPLAQAQEVLRAPVEELGVSAGAIEDTDGARTIFISRAHSFFEASYYSVAADGAVAQWSVPRKATLRGVHKEQVLFTLEEAWTPPGGTEIPNGALISVALPSLTTPAPMVQTLYGPGPRESIEDVEFTRDCVLVSGYENVRGRVLRFSYDGRAWLQSTIALPPNGSVHFAGADPHESTAFAIYENYTTPSTLYALDARAGTATPIRSLPAQFDASNVVAEQFEARSADGTMVPYFVVHRRDMPLNGQNPTLLWGYGGFQISYPPGYSPYWGKLWIEHGGVFVLANIRGGGEFGPAWHQAALRTHRQRAYDDFIGVAEDLIARNITSPRRLGIQGGSNGGLLMGVMLTQRPELFHAAVVQVPLLDMLRFDRLLAGASWVDEYGSPENPEERRFLESISPYQNLHRRPDFPTPFFVTSTKDDRVHPAHARKYAARMEELGMPFLYYENIDGGHAASANQTEAAHRRALEITYLMQRLMD